MSDTFSVGRETLPILDIQLPRRATSMHQCEITSHCTIACAYCPHPKMPRPKVHMTEAHFKRCLEWAVYYQKRGGQMALHGGNECEFNLAGIGESTMHPQFVEFVHLARAALGPRCQLTVATNGIFQGGRPHDKAFVDRLRGTGLRVTVSLHRPEKAMHAVRLYADAGLLVGISVDPSLNPNSWAGQIPALVPLERPENRIECPWIRKGWLFAMADGRISRCCLDATGEGVIGHLDDEIGSLKTDPWSLCPSCYQTIGIRGYTGQDGRLKVL